MAEYRYSISLRITHPTMDLTAVTEALGIEPSALWRVGEPRQTPNGTSLSGSYATGFWTSRLVDGSSVEQDLQSALSYALDTIELGAQLITEINSTGGRAKLFIGWFFDEGNSGDVLDHRFLSRIAQMGIDLSFDVYPETER